MEKIAFISDIHSNLPALKATLEDIRGRGVDVIYCLGDLIGYHTFTNEVIKVLQDEGVISIQGNHDKVIAEDDFDRDNIENFVLTWNSDELSKANREYLNNLPFSMEFSVEGVSIQIVHGSPDSISQYIREDSDEAEYFLNNMTTDVLISGHTHLPYIIEKSGKYLLNTGSVGKPKIGRPDSSYLLLEIEDRRISPQIITVSYPVAEITTHLKDREFPHKYIKALETGLA